MKRTALLLVASLFGAAGIASAYDSDPGYGPDSPWRDQGGRAYHREDDRWFPWRGGVEEPRNEQRASRLLIPLYFRPTQRYYGNGYTVNYRYIPVFEYDSPHSGNVGESSNFPTMNFHLTPNQVEAFGPYPARINVRDPQSQPRTAVTSIVRKKPAAKAAAGKTTPESPNATPGEAPAVTPSTATPALAPATAPAAPAPAPAATPESGVAPAKP